MTIEKSQSPAPAAPAAAAEPAKPVTFTATFNKQPRTFDLSNAKDAADLKAYAELGMFSEKQTAQVQALQAKVKQLEEDPDRAVGAGMREWMATDPVGASALRETFQALRERRLDPSQIHRALTAQQQGDAAGLEAQARATQDPQVQGILNQLATELRNVRTEVKTEIEGFRSSQAEKDRGAEIRAALTSDAIFGSSTAATRFGEGRIRELVTQGMPTELAASQAATELREVANATATAERDRLAAQQVLRTTPPTAGIPPMTKFAQDARAKIDPKLPPGKQQEAKRGAMRDYLQQLGERMRGSV